MGIVVAIAFLTITAWMVAGAKDVWIKRRQLGRKSWHAIVVASRKSVHHVEIPTFFVPELLHAFQKWREEFAGAHIFVGDALRSRPQPRNQCPPVSCLGQYASRPSDRRAAERDQQFPPSDGDCHTPLPCEVRRGNDTTP